LGDDFVWTPVEFSHFASFDLYSYFWHLFAPWLVLLASFP
jgi:hypothetical protein